MRPKITRAEVLVVVAIAITLTAIIVPLVQAKRAQAGQAQCLRTIRQVGLMTIMYQHDHQDRLPAAETFWQEVWTSESRSLACPAAPHYANGYCFNAALSRRDIMAIPYAEQAKVMLLCDGETTTPGKSSNLCYGAQDIAFRHRGKAAVLFFDGHVLMAAHADPRWFAAPKGSRLRK